MSMHEAQIMPSIAYMLEYYASIKISSYYIERYRNNSEFTI